jgi:hypothetical protein
MRQEEQDQKAFELLEKAVIKAQNGLKKGVAFNPFLFILTSERVLKTIENKAIDPKESYALLEDSLKQRVLEGNIDILIIAVDATLPERYRTDMNDCIQLHLEERSQLDKKISARFIYVPYKLYRNAQTLEVTVELGNPVPVGFPAQYLK